MILYFFCFIGYIFSSYVVYIQSKARKLDKKDSFSFGIKSGILGMIYYSVFAFILIFDLRILLILLSILAIIFGIIMTNISIFKQKDFCPLCTVIHVMNVIMLVLIL